MDTKTNATATATPCVDCQLLNTFDVCRRKHTMIAGLVEPSSSPFGFVGVSVALAAMGTCIMRSGGIPRCSNNLRADQGRTPGVAVGVSVCLWRQGRCENLRLIFRGHSNDQRKLNWRIAGGGKLKKQGTTGKGKRCLVGLRSAWKQAVFLFPIKAARTYQSLHILL